MSRIEIYPVPVGAKPSPDYRVEVNGHPVHVGQFSAGAFAAFGLEGSATVTVHGHKASVGPVVLRPLSRGTSPAASEDGAIAFPVDGPGHWYLETGMGPDLMVFVNPPEVNKPDPGDPSVRFYRAGKVHDAGHIRLESGQTLYVEGGAVVKGLVSCSGAHDVRIAGYGVLDARHYPAHSSKMIVFEGCENVCVEGVITVGTPSWNLVFGACSGVEVDNVKLIGWVVTSDGIDVVGSRHVHIHDSFFRNNDDCVAIKAIDPRDPNAPDRVYGAPRYLVDWRRDVSDVLVEKCVMYNDKAGNALEIGFETRTGSISDITFRDLDIIGAHGEGAVFSIHNGDRATVSDVLFEDIRVEHFYDKLIDLRILTSRYTKDSERGRIRGVRFKGIRTRADDFNCISLIAGFDPEHLVEEVLVEDFRMGDRKVLTGDELNLFVRHASGIKFA